MSKLKVKKSKIDLNPLSINQLRHFSETRLRKSIIIPLLKGIGAESVTDLHGSNEQGIDVYFEWFDIFSHRRRFGIQIKKGDLVYRSRPDTNKNILTICNQIKMAFSKEIILSYSKDGKISVHIDGYYVVISGRANQHAKDYIYQERKAFPYIHIIDGDELIRVINNMKVISRKGIGAIATRPSSLPILENLEGKT